MRELTQYVNPNIGTVGHLLRATEPAVYYPHGMMRVSPNFTPGIGDRYLADKIFSFPAGPVSVMAGRENMGAPPSGAGLEYFASVFDHDLEQTGPHRYEVFLGTPRVLAAYTVTKHSALFEFDFAHKPGYILLFMPEAYTQVTDGGFTTQGTYYDVPARAVGAVSQKPENVAVLHRFTDKSGENMAVYGLLFNGGKIQIKIGVSFIDLAQARFNLQQEIPGFDIHAVAETAQNIWNAELNKISVQGSEKHKRIFYTALYRALGRPYNFSEYGRYYSHYDRQVHNDDGHEFYCGDGLWDTFRCMHPLQLILEPKVHEDILASYIRMYEHSGLMPNFPFPARDRAAMIGFHSAALFADALVKNIDFNREKAYEGIRKNAFERSILPWCIAPSTELDEVYYEKGFFPALAPGQPEWVKEVHKFENRQSVAITLEHAYSDWCAYLLAKALGKESDAEILYKRGQNYRNLFNPETKFMAPKTADGAFIPGFDPKLSGGQGGRYYYAENNAWTYTFSVFHDIDGLIELFGGKEALARRLDDLFTEGWGTSKFDFLKQFPDATGLVGQFCMGNEPSFHIPYLYNYVGQSHKTQRKIHELIHMWFHDHPLGICGDEDGGAMSAWLVFSAMGFYPVCPGKPVYDIGSPIFDEIVIQTEQAKIKIDAGGASDKKKYIASASLDGKMLTSPILRHEDLYQDAVLRLEMRKMPTEM